MLSIDESITHEREVAEIHRNDIVPKEDYHNMPWIDKENELNMRSAEEHEQIAEWLEELKMLRELKEEHRKIGNIEGFNKGYNKAIDDFVNACKEDILCQTFGLHINGIERIAEQLKEGGKND